jgi:hypothetical protein
MITCILRIDVALRCCAPRGLLALVAAGCLVFSSCNSWNWRGDGYPEETVHWGEGLRKAPSSDGGAGSTASAGLDERAVQIEHDLGVH